MLFATHVHSNYSPDAIGTLNEVFEEALRIGLSYIAMTDHLELDNPKYHLLDVESYFADLMKFKDVYMSKGLYIATGIEVGWQPHTQKKAKQILDQFDFEYVVNSVHSFDGSASDTKNSYFKKYIKAVGDSVDACFDFDAVGHFGYLSRYNRFDENSMTAAEFGDEINQTIKKIVQRDTILEINSNSNLELSDTVPSLEILKIFKQLGGKLVTYAPDSHKIENLQRNLEKTILCAKNAGFSTWTIKKGKKRESVDIE